MKQPRSRHAKRMARHHNRFKSPALNLVSLMDIFTILVFFLLVNSSNTQQLPNAKTISLPESTAEQLPRETLTVMVNANEILVQGRRIASVSAALNSDQDKIPQLARELKYQAKKSRAPVNEAGEPQREITIMGDRQIPYELLKKIMLTCSANEYTRISLAVMKKNEEVAAS